MSFTAIFYGDHPWCKIFEVSAKHLKHFNDIIIRLFFWYFMPITNVNFKWSQIIRTE